MKRDREERMGVRTSWTWAACAGLLMASTVANAQGIRAIPVGVGFSQPVQAVVAPPLPQGQFDNRMFIVEQTGRIEILNLANSSVNATPFLNVSTLISSGGERGLFAMAFHPDYRNNDRFFIHYTNTAGNSVVAEYTVSANPDIANTTGTIIKSWNQDFANHNGGALEFGPDGMLYVGSGDGGSGNDPLARAQNINSLLGKILRLDVDAAAPYIPADNPFVGVAGRDEIWSYGIRNPWRLSFDSQTGDMYIGDVGQDVFEEIDYEPALQIGTMPGDAGYTGGRNYGWRCFEGTRTNITTGDCSPLPSPVTPPILEFSHTEPGVCSVTGGVVYRGSAMPFLDGMYFYADFCANFIRGFRQSGGVITEEQDYTASLGGISSIVDFGEDSEGEIYIVSVGGTIYKIVEDTVNCGCACVLNACSTEIFSDDFQSNNGWQTSINGATDGGWTRGVPIDDDNWDFDPIADADGSGNAFVTDNAAGNSDVDGGSVTLTSPQLDMSMGQITICYDYFLNMTNASTDSMIVEISSNGTSGPWTQLVVHNTSGGLGWRHEAIEQSQLDSAGVSLTSDMRVRFTVTDNDPQSIVEGGIDAFATWTNNTGFEDCNNNCIDDAEELLNGTAFDCNNNGILDSCDIEAGEVDCEGGPLGVVASGDSLLNTFCFGCHNTNGAGGAQFTGPNIRNRSRTFISNRITPPTDHPGGSFGFLDEQDFANLEAFLSDTGSRARPDGVPDSCQAPLPDCNGDGVSDACELENGTLQDLDHDGVPDNCGFIELRIVVSDEAGTGTDEGPVNVDPASPISLYLQARVGSDTSATGLTAWDGLFSDDDPNGAFDKGALTFREALNLDMAGLDPLGRTGMFPSYRGTIANDNDNPGNGIATGDDLAFVPLNLSATGNGEGINGMWANIYKVDWSTTDPTARTVTMSASGTAGGYQTPSGLREPVEVADDTITLNIGASCPCEFDGTDPVNINDLLGFLADYFVQEGMAVAPGTGADFNASGNVDINDLLGFLSCWFEASDGGVCP